MLNRQNLDCFAYALCDQNNGTMRAEAWVRRTLPRRNNHLLINTWFLIEYLTKFNDILHKYKTELFWFDGMISVPLVRTEILHFNGIYLGGPTLGTPVFMRRTVWLRLGLLQFSIKKKNKFANVAWNIVVFLFQLQCVNKSFNVSRIHKQI